MKEEHLFLFLMGVPSTAISNIAGYMNRKYDIVESVKGSNTRSWQLLLFLSVHLAMIYSSVLRMKFIMLTNVKMPITVGIFTFISRENRASDSSTVLPAKSDNDVVFCLQ